MPGTATMNELGDIKTTNLNRAQRVIQFPAPVPDARISQPPAAAPAVVDSVELSPEATALSDTFAGSNIRFEKVARIRSELQSGVYDLNGKIEAILDRVIQDLMIDE